jgi:hypothetical protein
MEAGCVNTIKEAFGQIENVFGLPIIFIALNIEKYGKYFPKNHRMQKQKEP